MLTQFLSVSLHRHIANTYKFDPFSHGFVEVLAAQQTNETADWFQGTADAVRQHIRYVREDGSREVMILTGDQLYRMDFRKLVQTHRDSGADVTIAVLPVRAARWPVSASSSSTMPATSSALSRSLRPRPSWARWPPPRTGWHRRAIIAHGRPYLASMGIYVFNRQVLIDLLNAPPLATDFGKEIFPRSIKTHHVQAHLFDGYWEDLGTVKAYHEANLALASNNPPFDFHSPDGVIYTRMRYLPASRLSGATVEQCLISDGCVINAGTRIEHSVIGVRSRIGRNAVVRDTIIIGADEFETDAERARNRERGVPDLVLGDHCVVERAIIDKDARIGNNVRIVNRQGKSEEEGDNYVIREGVVVIPRGSVVRDGTVI